MIAKRLMKIARRVLDKKADNAKRKARIAIPTKLRKNSLFIQATALITASSPRLSC
jgi:hypothetical protein